MSCNPPHDVDVSTKPYPRTPKLLPTWEIAVKCSVCISIELVALIGNILVIAIVAQSKKMRTTTNFYITNLAISDLFVACLPFWTHLVNDVADGWILGGFICKFNAFVQITAMFASVFTLMAIAGDRFFAIIFPLKSRMTQRKVSVVIVLVWLSSAAIAAPSLFVYTYTERRWKDYKERFCADVWPVQETETDGVCDGGLTSKRAYWFLVVVVLNWVPMLVMTIAYTFIVIKLRFNRIVPSSGELSLLAIQQRSKRKVVKMLFSVLIVFMVCTIPFQVSKLFELYRDDRSERLPSWYNPLYFSAIVMMYTNSAINPILYGGLNENFRNGFKDLINAILNRKSNKHKKLLHTLWIANRSRMITVDELGTKPDLSHLQVPSVAVQYLNQSTDVDVEVSETLRVTLRNTTSYEQKSL